MILSVGEILADIVFDSGSLQMFIGGAPFNMAVNASLAGAKACFAGRVGNDPVGKFLLDKAGQYGLEKVNISVDDNRNTTLAFVSLENGERDFAFFRNGTADFNISIDDINFDDYAGLDILHVGSLMLSEDAGRALAEKLVAEAKSRGLVLSFDVNLRQDVFRMREFALKAYRPMLAAADIIKFSDDEILYFSGESTLAASLEKFADKDKIVIVTMGKQGCAYSLFGKSGYVKSTPVKPIDATGAGDAFYGTLLANIDFALARNKRDFVAALKTNLSEDMLIEALQKANAAGAAATQHKGALSE